MSGTLLDATENPEGNVTGFLKLRRKPPKRLAKKTVHNIKQRANKEKRSTDK